MSVSVSSSSAASEKDADSEQEEEEEEMEQLREDVYWLPSLLLGSRSWRRICREAMLGW